MLRVRLDIFHFLKEIEYWCLCSDRKFGIVWVDLIADILQIVFTLSMRSYSTVNSTNWSEKIVSLERAICLGHSGISGYFLVPLHYGSRRNWQRKHFTDVGCEIFVAKEATFRILYLNKNDFLLLLNIAAQPYYKKKDIGSSLTESYANWFAADKR